MEKRNKKTIVLTRLFLIRFLYFFSVRLKIWQYVKQPGLPICLSSPNVDFQRKYLQTNKPTYPDSSGVTGNVR